MIPRLSNIWLASLDYSETPIPTMFDADAWAFDTLAMVYFAMALGVLIVVWFFRD